MSGEPKQKEQVIRAINALKRSVTPADIAHETGVSLSDANLLLNQIASETLGRLQVSDHGEVLYSFRVGFERTYAERGFKHVVASIFSAGCEAMMFLFKVLFSLFFVASLLSIGLFIQAIVVLFAVISSISGNDSPAFNQLEGVYSPSVWGEVFSSDNRPSEDGKPRDTNFLFDVFDFVFGPGKPQTRTQLEADRWKLMAAAIHDYGGAVTCEQVAPYLDTMPSNEDAMLPVLVRFNGQPEVTTSGYLVYVFPDLQPTAAIAQTQPQAEAHQQATNSPVVDYWQGLNLSRDKQLAPYLVQPRWQQCDITFERATFIGFLGVVNAGLIYILMVISAMFLLLPIAFVLGIMLGYAVFFLGFPLIRFWVNLLLNQDIDFRNERRRRCAEIVLSPADELQKKFEEANTFASAPHAVSDHRVIYDTLEDHLTQQIETNQSDL